MTVIKRTPIALAVAGLFATPIALAADANTAGSQLAEDQAVLSVDNSNDAHLSDGALQNASGNIGVNVAAGESNQQSNATSVASDTGTEAEASAARSQVATDLDFASDGTENTAHLHGDVLRGASGNIGVNLTAGNGNQQSNDLAVASQAGTEGETVQADVALSQSLTGLETAPVGTLNEAQLSGNALRDARGNIGVNAAAGNANQQANGLAIARAESADTAVASAAAAQILTDNVLPNADGVDNEAELKAAALQDASGNIAVNVAAGQGNQQGNGLAVAVSDAGLAAATAGTAQFATANIAVNPADTTNTAVLAGTALQGASGNIGVNITAGGGNQQSNTMALSRAR